MTLLNLKNIIYYKRLYKIGVWLGHHNDFDNTKMWALEYLNDFF